MDSQQFGKVGDTSTSVSYESLVLVSRTSHSYEYMTHVVETIESGELRELRHKVKAITDAHVLVYGNR